MNFKIENGKTLTQIYKEEYDTERTRLLRQNRENKKHVQSVLAMSDLLNGIPVGEGRLWLAGSRTLYIYTPRNEAIIGEVERYIEQYCSAHDGPRWDETDDSSSDGQFTINITTSLNGRTSLWVHIIFDSEMPGATCERVQIGTKKEIKDIPIYEVRCHG